MLAQFSLLCRLSGVGCLTLLPLGQFSLACHPFWGQLPLSPYLFLGIVATGRVSLRPRVRTASLLALYCPKLPLPLPVQPAPAALTQLILTHHHFLPFWRSAAARHSSHCTHVLLPKLIILMPTNQPFLLPPPTFLALCSCPTRKPASKSHCACSRPRTSPHERQGLSPLCCL